VAALGGVSVFIEIDRCSPRAKSVMKLRSTDGLKVILLRDTATATERAEWPDLTGIDLVSVIGDGLAPFEEGHPPIDPTLVDESALEEDFVTSTGTRPAPKPRAPYSKDFETFWAARAWEGSKLKAYEAFKKSSVPALEVLLQAVKAQEADRERFAASPIAGDFYAHWKHAVTWLNQRCWEDRLKFPKVVNIGSASAKPPEERILARMLHGRGESSEGLWVRRQIESANHHTGVGLTQEWGAEALKTHGFHITLLAIAKAAAEAVEARSAQNG
jgi:hypothetical protein